MAIAALLAGFVGFVTAPQALVRPHEIIGVNAVKRAPASSMVVKDPAPSGTPTAEPATTAVTETTQSASSSPVAPAGYGCGPALAYLSGHANPEFSFECPGYAEGNEAMTCIDIAGACPAQHLIVINDPCPAAYMNEAYNSQSWSDELQQFTRPIDPYGAC